MSATVRHDWTLDEVRALFAQPFNDLLFQAQQVHRQHFDANRVQVSTLLSIKTGACPEDCKYCPQSGHYNTGLDKEKLMEAHKNPMLHPDLVVRVTGFTAYFAALSPEFRQLVVDRFIEGL